MVFLLVFKENVFFELAYFLMEDKNEIIRSKLICPGNKFILFTSSIFSAENFLKKLSSFSKAEKTNKQKFEKIIIITYSLDGFYSSFFFIIKKIEYFFEIYDKNQLNRNYLKEFSISLFSKFENIDDFSNLFKQIIIINSIKEQFIFNSNKKIIFLDSEEITQKHISTYFCKKFKIFKVKKIHKLKRKNLTKKGIIKKNSNEKELLLENSVKINSLIHISKEVKKFIKMKQHTNYNEVTNFILKSLKEKLNKNEMNQCSITYKNIQRRVYDAINVMNALKIIHKDNTNLTYHKLNQIKLKEEIENKKNIIISKFIELNCYKNLIEKNKNNYLQNCSSEKIELPFNLLISDSPEEEISIRTNKEKNKLIACYNNGKFHTFSQISKELFYNELFNINMNENDDIVKYINENKLIEKYLSDLNIRKKKKEEIKQTKNQLFEIDFSNYLSNMHSNSTKFNNESNNFHYEINDNNSQMNNYNDKNAVFL